MIRGAPPPASAFPERPEQFAQQRAIPTLTRPQQLFKSCTQALDFLGIDIRRARAERAVDQFDRLVERWMSYGRGDVVFGIVTSQLEFEQPSLRCIVGCDAVHLQPAKFRQRCRESDRPLARPACILLLHHRCDRRQADEIARREVDKLAWLPGCVGDGRDQVEAHRMPEPQRKHAILEMDLVAFFGAAWQQAHAPRCRASSCSRRASLSRTRK